MIIEKIKNFFFYLFFNKTKIFIDSIYIPSPATKGSVGYDVIAYSYEVVYKENNFLYVEYNTGIKIQMPKNFFAIIFPRSSITNTGFFLGNSSGVIDSDYRGFIKMRFYNNSGINNLPYKVGDKIGQLLFFKQDSIFFQRVNALEDTIRNENGFGSTN